MPSSKENIGHCMIVQKIAFELSKTMNCKVEGWVEKEYKHPDYAEYVFFIKKLELECRVKVAHFATAESHILFNNLTEQITEQINIKVDPFINLIFNQ